MSSNSGVIINRSNETSPFLQALKSRNSKSLPELYSSEVNTEAQAQSRVEVESSSASGYNRTLRISLPRYGLLNKLYIHSVFSGGTLAETSTVGLQHVPFIGAFAFREIRLMYNGATIAKMNPHTIVADLWKHSSDNDKKKLIELLGALDTSAVTSGLPGTGDLNSARADKLANMTRCASSGEHNFYLPLDMWFSSKLSPNRQLDLSVLANEVLLELDVDSSANIWKMTGTDSTYVAPSISNVSAVCYLTELDMEVEKQYRSLQYQAGGAPMTQIGFDTSHIVVSSSQAHTSADSYIDIKLNQFTGQVFKLVVYATLADNFPTNLHRIKPVQLNEIQLKATGTNIVNLDSLDKKQDILENYHSGGAFISLHDISASATQNWEEAITCNPNNFYEITFKHPYDFSKVSASGSVAFGQLSVPSLRVQVKGSTGGASGFAGGNIAAVSFGI